MELGVCLWWWWWRQRCCFFVDDENFIFLFLATAHQFRCLCLSQTIFPPGTIIFPKKRSFHFIWISQNLWGPLIRGGKALIQGQNSNPQPFISVLSNKCKVFKLSFLHVLFNLLFYGLRRFSWIGRSLAEQRFSQRWIWKNDWQWWWLNIYYDECVSVCHEKWSLFACESRKMSTFSRMSVGAQLPCWSPVHQLKHQLLQKTAFSLVKSRLALGPVGCLLVCLFLCSFVTMPKMAKYTG